jgi:lipoprotein-anchoring transpeptidase ErfK/SrfK
MFRSACIAAVAVTVLGASGSAEARRAAKTGAARAPQVLSAARINDAQSSEATAAKGTSAALIKAGVLLDRLAISPGIIDGRSGENMSKAIVEFQRRHGLNATGRLDVSTFEELTQTSSEPAIIDYKISAEDVRGPFLDKVPSKLEEMARLPRLGYRSPAELLAEKFHVSEALLKLLNSGKPLDRAGTFIAVPNVAGARPDSAVARIEVDKAAKAIRALGRDNEIVAFYPASIGSAEKPAPSGEYRVRRVAENPDYHYDPKFKFKGVKTNERLTVAAGPNNPVGVVWIDLTKPSYGIHGTPDPEKIGKTQSHGCIRLTNWDALDLARRVRKGATVAFIDAGSERVGEIKGKQRP